MSEKHICCGYNKAKGMTGILFKAHHKDFFKCNAVAKFNEGDKWYCKRHLPSAIKIRDEKRWQTYINKINNGLEINKTVN